MNGGFGHSVSHHPGSAGNAGTSATQSQNTGRTQMSRRQLDGDGGGPADVVEEEEEEEGQVRKKQGK